METSSVSKSENKKKRSVGDCRVSVAGGALYSCQTLFYCWVGIFVVVYWRGTWVLMDQVLSFPSNTNTTTTAMDPTALSAWISMAIGVAGLLAAAITQAILAHCPCGGEHVAPLPRGRCVCLGALERVYWCALAFFTVNFWRGVWLLCDVYVLPEHPLESSLVTHLAGTIVLLLCGHVASLVAPPFMVVADNHSEPCTAEATALQQSTPSSFSMSGGESDADAPRNVYTVIKPVSCCWSAMCGRADTRTDTQAGAGRYKTNVELTTLATSTNTLKQSNVLATNNAEAHPHQ